MNDSETKEIVLTNFCSKCHGETNHRVLFKKHVDNDPNVYDIRSTFKVVECMGCERVSYRTDTHDIENAYPDQYGDWTVDTTTDIYPNPLKGHKPLSRIHVFPSQIKTVYEESVNAFRSYCYLLAGVGFRAVIEAVCIDKEVKGRDLESKINNLAKNRLITDKEADRLHSIRFIGNDSVHEMSVPKESALYIVLNIIEHLLSNLYLIDHYAKGQIDTITSSFDEFMELLEKHMAEFKVGDAFPLAKLFGKDTRRLSGRLSEFEAKLMDEIKAGNYKHMDVGKVAPFGNTSDTYQHFVIKSLPQNPDDVPF